MYPKPFATSRAPYVLRGLMGNRTLTVGQGGDIPGTLHDAFGEWQRQLIPPDVFLTFELADGPMDVVYSDILRHPCAQQITVKGKGFLSSPAPNGIVIDNGRVLCFPKIHVEAGPSYGAGYTPGVYDCPIVGGTLQAGATAAKLRITIGASGKPVAVEDIATERGLYTVIPANPVTVTGLPAGTGASFDVRWGFYAALGFATAHNVSAGDLLEMDLTGTGAFRAFCGCRRVDRVVDATHFRFISTAPYGLTTNPVTQFPATSVTGGTVRRYRSRVRHIGAFDAVNGRTDIKRSEYGSTITADPAHLEILCTGLALEDFALESPGQAIDANLIVLREKNSLRRARNIGGYGATKNGIWNLYGSYGEFLDCCFSDAAVQNAVSHLQAQTILNGGHYTGAGSSNVRGRTQGKLYLVNAPNLSGGFSGLTGEESAEIEASQVIADYCEFVNVDADTDASISFVGASKARNARQYNARVKDDGIINVDGADLSGAGTSDLRYEGGRFTNAHTATWETESGTHGAIDDRIYSSYIIPARTIKDLETGDFAETGDPAGVNTAFDEIGSGRWILGRTSKFNLILPPGVHDYKVPVEFDWLGRFRLIGDGFTGSSKACTVEGTPTGSSGAWTVTLNYTSHGFQNGDLVRCNSIAGGDAGGLWRGLLTSMFVNGVVNANRFSVLLTAKVASLAALALTTARIEKVNSVLNFLDPDSGNFGAGMGGPTEEDPAGITVRSREGILRDVGLVCPSSGRAHTTNGKVHAIKLYEFAALDAGGGVCIAGFEGAAAWVLYGSFLNADAMYMSDCDEGGLRNQYGGIIRGSGARSSNHPGDDGHGAEARTMSGELTLPNFVALFNGGFGVASQDGARVAVTGAEAWVERNRINASASGDASLVLTTANLRNATETNLQLKKSSRAQAANAVLTGGGTYDLLMEESRLDHDGTATWAAGKESLRNATIDGVVRGLTEEVIKTDFVGPGPWGPWSSNIGNSATVTGVAASSAIHDAGMQEWSTAALNNGRVHYMTGTGGTHKAWSRGPTGRTLVLRQKIRRIDAVPDGTDSYRIEAGFFDQISVAQDNCAMFLWDETTANLRAVCGASTTYTEVDLGFVPVLNTWYELEIRVAATAKVEFLIDGVLVATITTNVPTAGMHAGGGIRKTAGTNARRFQSAWIEVFYKRAM